MNDILYDAITSAGIDADYTNSGTEIFMECPLCDDHKKRLYINRRSFLWICHNCDEAGGLTRFLEQVLRIDPFVAYRLRKQIEGVKAPVVSKKPEVERADVDVPMALPDGFLPLDNPDDPLQRQFFDYLRSRGIDDLMIRAHRMGYCLSGYFSYRVIVPITRNGIVKGWIARAIVNATDHPGFKKVLTSQGSKTSQMLFNLDHVKGLDEIGLVEGVFDALTLPDRLVASLGAKLSPYQRLMLREAGVKSIILFYDPDEAGIDATVKVAHELLASGFGVKVASLPPGIDANEAGAALVKKALGEAVEVVLESKHKLREVIKEIQGIKQ